MSDEMNDDKLTALGKMKAAEPSAEARKLALNAALVAFDGEQGKKSAGAPQGKDWWERLRSIVRNKRISIMDMRIPLGTAAIALLLLPLGYQLYNTTALTPPGALPQQAGRSDQPVDVVAALDKDKETKTLGFAAPVEAPKEEIGQLAAASSEAAKPDVSPQESSPTPAESANATMTAPMAPPMADARSSGGATSVDGLAAGTLQTGAFGKMSESEADALPAPGYGAVPTEPSGDEFTKFTESPVKIVAEEPVSTFSIDVDTAAYSYVRSVIGDGYVPEPDAVRIEELINYFPYDYAAPDRAETPFKPVLNVFPTPWNPKTEILRIGIKGYVPPAAEHQPENLTFLIDTSGSMDEPNKLPLLKRALGLLVDQLSAGDTVAIVVYAGSAGLVLEPTKASSKAKILAALDNLYAGGSTAGAEGIELAYRVAAESRIANGVNRVILATDGDFNVGISDPEDLKTYIKSKRDSGIFLSVLGFGRGNLDDALMQSLAQNGNGNASYIDSFREAQKVLVEQGGATLNTIAKDVKIQVEFNPALVAEYRLIGYETRALNREDFNNDTVDAGEIGAGHTVTALYEITPVGAGGSLVDPLRYGPAPSAAVVPGGELGFLKIRYKGPDEDVSKLIETPISQDLVVNDIAKAPEDARFAAAVAAFGQKLKGSNYGETITWKEIAALAQGARGEDKNGYRAEFVQLVNTAALLDPDKPASVE